MLQDEIDAAQRRVKTDAYQMSIGEIVNMYKEGEFVINPDFQRLFRWEPGQKSKLIKSILLGIPLPPIFVYEKASLAGMALVAAVATFSLYWAILGQGFSRHTHPRDIRCNSRCLIIYCVWVRVSDLRQARKAPAVVPTTNTQDGRARSVALPSEKLPEDFTPAQWRQYLAYRQRRERDKPAESSCGLSVMPPFLSWHYTLLSGFEPTS